MEKKSWERWALIVTGIVMIGMAVSAVADRGAVAAALVPTGAMLLLGGVIFPFIEGRFRLGPFEAQLREVRRELQEVSETLKELSGHVQGRSTVTGSLEVDGPAQKAEGT